MRSLKGSDSKLTTTDSPQHRFPVYDFDPLELQVCEREDEDVIRDPEADAEPQIIRVESGKQAEPVPVQMPERRVWPSEPLQRKQAELTTHKDTAPFDPLAAQVAARQEEVDLRDPERDAEPQIIELHNGREPGVTPVDPHPSQLEGKYRE
jgi:hypothetical protein